MPKPDKLRAEYLEEERKRRIYDLWLACYTQDEIAEEVGISPPAVRDALEVSAEVPKLEKVRKLRAEYLEEEWHAPLFNIWNFAARGCYASEPRAD